MLIMPLAVKHISNLVQMTSMCTASSSVVIIQSNTSINKGDLQPKSLLATCLISPVCVYK